MYTTWILVAHRSGARVFENRSPSRNLVRIRELSHPEGRLRDQDINTDRPGREHVEGARQSRQTYSSNVDAHDHKAEQFAREIATVLDQGRNQRDYSKLVLVAEPRFLGMIKSTLSPATADKVVMTVSKDLSGMPDREVLPLLNGNLEPIFSDIDRYGT